MPVDAGTSKAPLAGSGPTSAGLAPAASGNHGGTPSQMGPHAVSDFDGRITMIEVGGAPDGAEVDIALEAPPVGEGWAPLGVGEHAASANPAVVTTARRAIERVRRMRPMVEPDMEEPRRPQ